MKKVFTTVVILITCLIINAQGKITGYVYDSENGKALAGANVLVKETAQGAVSNELGYFTIDSVETGLYELLISFVGYESEVHLVEMSDSLDVQVEISLDQNYIEFDRIVVTASKSEQKVNDVAGRIELINSRDIKSTPIAAPDDLIKYTAGVKVDRPGGIAGRPTIGIRGLVAQEQGRLLAMIDGTPINKADGGTVNWNRINPLNIQRVEIFKGPGSSIYGSNAMAGVINFISKNEKRAGIKGEVKGSYGSFNTIGQSLYLSGRFENNKGIYFNLSAMNRETDGYNEIKESYRDEYSVKSYMEEYGINGTIGYDFENNSSVELSYEFYDDKRGQGEKIKLDDGSYMKHKTNLANLIYKTEMSGIKAKVNLFYQMENYLRTREKGDIEDYTLYNVDADRSDFGALLNLNYNISGHNLSFGGDLKVGEIKGSDIYKTSPDVVTNKGTMVTMAGYLNDEFKLTEKLSVTAGFRFDKVFFDDGEFILTNTTSETSFLVGFDGELDSYNWGAFTPKLSLKYQLSSNISSYISVSQGFRAPTLDDMTRTGLIRNGFKIANPELEPETITNYEIGFNFDVNKKFFFLPSFYLMQGNDFLYYVGTGESIWGGKRPIIKKQNITEVEIFGADIDIKYFLTKNIIINANYTFTDAKIKAFENSPELENKKFTYTPEHMGNLSITYLNKYINCSFMAHYQGEQFTTDNNSVIDKYGESTIIEEYYTVDIRLWHKIFERFNLGLNIQNILDEQYEVTYDKISIGRFISADISIEF